MTRQRGAATVRKMEVLQMSKDDKTRGKGDRRRGHKIEDVFQQLGENFDQSVRRLLADRSQAKSEAIRLAHSGKKN